VNDRNAPSLSEVSRAAWALLYTVENYPYRPPEMRPWDEVVDAAADLKSILQRLPFEEDE
jgi:hypothetical protein